MKFASYAIVSTLVTAAACYFAWQTRQQFYPATIYMTTAKHNVVILANFGLMLLVLFGKILQRIFLGELARDEVEETVNLAKYAVTETALALTVFREELYMDTLSLFAMLLFVKIFHWLSALRVDNLGRHHEESKLAHIRLSALLVLLLWIDLFTGLVMLVGLMEKMPSVLLLFAFEYAILAVTTSTTIVKYILVLIDQRRGGQWEEKSIWVFYCEFAGDLLRLGLYLTFFAIVTAFYGLPLHLIREVYITFYTLRDRVVRFVHYRRLTSNMNARFPDATPDELANSDRTCIICREDMETAKKLPCNHLFHFRCLRTWLERSSTCPTCRAAIPLNPLPQQQQRQQQQQPQGQQGQQQQPQQQQQAQAQQPDLAAIAARLPPLPPHLAAAVARRQQQPSTAAPQSPQPAAAPAPAITPATAAAPAPQQQQQRQLPAPVVVGSIPASAPGLGLSPSPSAPATEPAMSLPSYPAAAPQLPPLPPSGVSGSPGFVLESMLRLCQQQTLMLQMQMDLLQTQLFALQGVYERQLAWQEALISALKQQQQQQQQDEKTDSTGVTTTSVPSSHLPTTASGLSAAAEQDEKTQGDHGSVSFANERTVSSSGASPSGDS